MAHTFSFEWNKEVLDLSLFFCLLLLLLPLFQPLIWVLYKLAKYVCFFNAKTLICNIISFNAINNLGASSSKAEEKMIPSLPTELAHELCCVAFFSPFLFVVVVLLFFSSSFRMTFFRLLWATLQSGSAPSAVSNR